MSNADIYNQHMKWRELNDVRFKKVFKLFNQLLNYPTDAISRRNSLVTITQKIHPSFAVITEIFQHEITTCKICR
jgi:hypothetical protein